MIKINKVESGSIKTLRSKYYDKVIAPLDDMWEDAIIPSGDFYTINDEEIIGYFVIGDNNTMLQYYIKDNYKNRASEIFDYIIEEKELTEALVGTFELEYLILCLDRNSKVEVDTLLYIEQKTVNINSPIDTINIEIATMDDFTKILSFCENKVGLEGDWMKNYYKDLLPKSSIYLFKIGKEIIGIGELRPSKSNSSYANLGVMVSSGFRKKNIGSYIMSHMRNSASARGLKGICSTTKDNIGSQKVIEKSGFYAYHRILRIKFKPTHN